MKVEIFEKRNENYKPLVIKNVISIKYIDDIFIELNLGGGIFRQYDMSKYDIYEVNNGRKF